MAENLNVYCKKPEEQIYFSQRNNKQFPYRSCFPTSLAMAARNNGFVYDPKFVHPTLGELELDDYIFYVANSPEGQTIATKLGIPVGTKFLNEWWYCMEKVGSLIFNKQGIKCRVVPMSNKTVYENINKGKMLVAATKFTGSGHIVCISGYQPNGQYIVNDPYGNVLTGYSNTDGKCVQIDSKWQQKFGSYLMVFE